MTYTLAPSAATAPAQDTARFLRLVLRVDSVSTAVMGLVLVAAAAPLGSLTGCRWPSPSRSGSSSWAERAASR